MPAFRWKTPQAVLTGRTAQAPCGGRRILTCSAWLPRHLSRLQQQGLFRDTGERAQIERAQHQRPRHTVQVQQRLKLV